MNRLRGFMAGLLYMGLALGAIPAGSGELDIPYLETLRTGEMRKLIFSRDGAGVGAPPALLAEDILIDASGAKTSLGELAAGRTVLVNFWATWCPPCRHEMPSLDALAAEVSGEDFAILPIATGRNDPDAIKAFFAETGITRLPEIHDRGQRLSRSLGVFGLPTTVILAPDGTEVARLTGDADWHSQSAQAIIGAIIDAFAR